MNHIIWINGAFGAGKTSVAEVLVNRLENAFIFDPENAGGLIRVSLPEPLQNPNFQDEMLWRKFNNLLLKKLSFEYNGTIIIPMTILNQVYFKEITEGINPETKLHHFILNTTDELLETRIKNRGFSEEATQWALGQIKECQEKLPLMAGIAIDTSNISINEVSEEVLKKIKYIKN